MALSLRCGAQGNGAAAHARVMVVRNATGYAAPST